ncbi:1,4-alpha-glucan branching protein domain-containing protein [Halalkalibacter urbisdiaboli]|uniref:1,4-alpha-glucan branching protein domain-containing protein n=1 Tax=Halalkalibacter urbisdiaboli TaxID=1960589 RepID=UPI000B45206E|nr:1,4-alpha-glucan branching protein domain-containing protein [Halalkalibacter urbisdiaboli]
MKEGYYSLVLHAHLPFVRHEEENRLEERWLFEAITETYIPLLWSLESASVKGAVTISFSPPLMEMLADRILQERYVDYLLKTEELIGKEETLAKDESMSELVSFYKERYQKIKKTFLEWDKNILQAFRHLAEQGLVTLMTSAATHAFLPYVKTKAAIRSQVVEGIRTFEKHFGWRPLGFWLPECAIAPGIDRILIEEGIRYTFVDEHSVLHAEPTPSKKSGAPIYSPHGLLLFPRHTDLSSHVWSSTLGYPGDVDYREFYRDIAYEREWDYIKPYVHPEGIRIDTGLKHKRITGNVEEKEIYVRNWALNKVHAHATHFIESIHKEIEKHGEQCFPPYIMVTPFDAELFGHWWYEGPEWIEAILLKGKDSISFISPEEYLRRHYQDFDTCHVSFSTWGRDGYGDVWLNERNAYIYSHLHRMEQDLAVATAVHCAPSPIEKRMLKQMVREWMLAVSSDWAFILDNQSAAQYADERFRSHVTRFDHLKEKLLEKNCHEDDIAYMERTYPFLEDVDETLFISPHDRYVQEMYHAEKPPQRNILMLSWEYPPMVVGGLSRHVFDLSRTMVSKGDEVHVITSFVDGYPEYEVNQGVHVHRIRGLQPEAASFYDWVASLNVAMAKYVEKLARKHTFDLIHAHDWLVSVAAKSLKAYLELPLIATIHATEHGRNDGIHSSLQHEIHQKEWELMYEAKRVIVCSDYMKEEVQTLFDLPEEKITIIANGVDEELIRPKQINQFDLPLNNKFTVFSVGRIVKEKGYQTVIEAAEIIRERERQIQFVIAGKGPMLEEYRLQVQERGLEEYIQFLGYISDDERNEWFQRCDATVFPSLYEPFGIVALEGMAAGKATIVSDTGGLRGIIEHGENGLRMIPGDAQSLASQVLYLYNHPILREGLATQGFRDLKTKFNWNTIAEQTQRVIDRCLDKKLLVVSE